MAYCSNCGSEIASDEAACAECQTEQTSIPGTISAESQARFPPSQILAGVWIAAAIGLMIFLGSTVWLLVPSIVASLWPLLRNLRLSAWVDRQEERMVAAATRAQEKTGKIAHYFSRPLYRGFLWIWRKTEPIADLHVRTGVRVGSVLYFGGAMLFLGALVGYVLVVLVVVVVALWFALWLAGHMISGKPFEFGRSDDSEPSSGSWFSSGRAQPARSRPSTDFLGNSKTELLDKKGKKIGEIQPTIDFLGDPKEEVFDSDGKKIGERRADRDFFGDPITSEHDAIGEKVGESRPETDWLGDPVEEHFNTDGEKVGESQPDTDFLGNPETRHTWKKKGASG